MISVGEARGRILAGLAPTGPETVPLAAGWNRVLARPVIARLTQPPADVSAMDGYAVRAADAVEGNILRLSGASPAGKPFSGEVGPGEAVRIFTGGFVPPGADTILIQENAEALAEGVRVTEGVAEGRHIRRRGLDFAEGGELLPAGRRLTARDVGLAAAGNHPWLIVHRRPRIGILATGDEIALPGEALPAGGIVSSNAHALAAMVASAGGEAGILPIAPDDPAAIASLAGSGGYDLLVTTGGASVGEHDLVQKALGRDGFVLDFWQIAMRPGKPLIWGRLGSTPVLGLPGNPVSALVCAVIFLLPALARMQGLADTAPPVESAIAGAELPANDKRADHLRATLARDDGGRWVATPNARQDSSMLGVLARADALILRAPFAPAVPKGEAVEVIRLQALGV
ncbi:gephyrin-like molybdotransferase Glp [Roseococcus sp. YIM B11640]|uniref:molybdopterin molybdotransferase MoeA n=1 Tax=Roseococcus sp. YIM B11640 TaxID=3133973 RepID=UPI003C7B3837